jgi:hypothetical protein
VVFVNGLAQNKPIAIGLLDIKNDFLAVLVLEDKFLHRDHQIGAAKSKIQLLVYDLLQVFLNVRGTLSIVGYLIDCAVRQLAELFDQHCVKHLLGQANVGSTQGKDSRDGLLSVFLRVLNAVLDPDVTHLRQLPEPFIVWHVNPADAAEAALGIFGRHISDCKRLIFSQIYADSLFSGFYVAENLI